MSLSKTVKNIIIGVVTAVLITIVGGTWSSMAKVQAAFAQLSVNTQAIESIGTAMELRGIDRIIESKQREIRANEVKIVSNPNNIPLKTLLEDQNKKLADEIAMQHIIRECVVDPTKAVCK